MPKPPHYQGAEVRTIFGLDLGKVHDFTALSCVDRFRWSMPTTADTFADYVWYGCRAIKQYDIKTDYPVIVDNVKEIVARPEFVDPVIVVDATGVGVPVVDWMRRARMRARIIPVTICGGASQRWEPETGSWWVAKQILISNIQLLLQVERFKIAAEAENRETAMQELRTYQCKLSKAGNEIYNAREGEHDDIVLSLAVACWYGERAQRKIAIRV